MLNLDAGISAPDEFYAALIDAHRGLTMAESARVNARLILLLANQIGDVAVLRAALLRARDGVAGSAAPERRPDTP